MEKSKYKSLAEWRKKNPNLYVAAYKKGIVKKICETFGWKYKEKLNRKKSGYWTIEKCKEEAFKYKTISEWQKKSVSSYSIAYKNGWVKKCCVHMKFKERFVINWTLNKCKKEALKYKTRFEWAKSNISSYSFARKNNWLDECCLHMKILKKEWSEKKCIQSALKYKSKIEWVTNDNNAYQASKRLGCFEKCCQHFNILVKPHGYWKIKENCAKAALECISKEQMKKKYGKALVSIRENNWFDELCKHFNTLNKPARFWDKKNCIDAALECKTPTEFKNKYGYAYKIVCKNNWNEECYKHM